MQLRQLEVIAIVVVSEWDLVVQYAMFLMLNLLVVLLMLRTLPVIYDYNNPFPRPTLSFQLDIV